MKIAQIAPMGETVPPKKYGGTERVVHALTEGLVKRGHEVTLFASGDSKTSARLISVYPQSLREALRKNPYGAEEIAMLNVGLAYKLQHEFDIIHDHAGYISLPISTLATTPVAMTIHGAPTPEGKRLYETLSNPNNPHFVSVSYAQRKPMPNLNYIANIYNGLEFENYPFANENDGYLLFVGRIHPDKGVHHAIEVAEFLNLPLIMAAKLDIPQIPYYKRYIEPKLSDKITWIGEVTTQKRNKLMSRALCLLHPIEWREPFGLTLIEAMACGCPPVAFRRGSIPEIIKHTKTGFIAEDTTEMIEYVRSIGKIKRKNCRTYALQKFNAERMILDYEELYKKILRISETETFKSPIIKSPIKN